MIQIYIPSVSVAGSVESESPLKCSVLHRASWFLSQDRMFSIPLLSSMQNVITQNFCKETMK